MDERKTSTAMIAVRDLVKTVDSGHQQLTILRGVDFDVKSGESMAIVGASGSGKSTLLGLMAGLDLPSSGEIWLAGQALHEMDEEQRAALRARETGFVFQSFLLVAGLTARENVQLPLDLAGRRNAASEAAALLERVGLAHRLDHYPSQLSGGEQQRVAIARAFIARPRVLFADEPTGNLDHANGRRIADLLFELNRENRTTLVIVTHDTVLAEACDRQRVMRDGILLPEALANPDSPGAAPESASEPPVPSQSSQSMPGRSTC